MSSVPLKHNAAVFTGEKDDLKLIEIATIKTPTPGKGELLIKTEANALNPTDWKHTVCDWGDKGSVPGTDAAGVVVSVGSDVTGFKVGDHVSVFTHGGYSVTPLSGSFQEYFIADPYLTINFGPSSLGHDTDSSVPAAKITTFEGASSVTLAVVTIGLSYFNNFKLHFDKSKQAGKAILIWGGASATGFIAVQIAKKVFGLEVIVAASAKHEALLKSLGADKLFDYHDADVVEHIRAYAGDRLVYGYDTVGSKQTINQVYDSLSDSYPAICENLLLLGEDLIVKKRENIKFTFSVAYLARGVDQVLNGHTFKSSEEIKVDHEKFWDNITKFVVDGTILHAPLSILPNGLNSIDEGLALLRNEKISGEKLVFRIADTTK